MGHKIEDWEGTLRHEFPQMWDDLLKLSPRECSIVSVAFLDMGLATVITKRLVELPAESADFLGLDGDGRAPAASFGARIQLALLLGIITETDAAVLRAFKGIRNVCAHQMKINMCESSMQKYMSRMSTAWGSLQQYFAPTRAKAIVEATQNLKPLIGKSERACQLFLLVVAFVYHHYLSQLSDSEEPMPRIAYRI